MTGRLYKNQEELDAELASLQEVLGEHPCELVRGEVPTPVLGAVGVPVDQKLKQALLKQFKLLERSPKTPCFVLYQLQTGQRSVICVAKDVNNELLFSYRDFDARPPTKRVKDTVQEAVDEYLNKG